MDLLFPSPPLNETLRPSVMNRLGNAKWVSYDPGYIEFLYRTMADIASIYIGGVEVQAAMFSLDPHRASQSPCKRKLNSEVVQ